MKAKKGVLCTTPAQLQGTAPPPALAPFPALTQGEVVTLTQLCLAAPQPHARLRGHCAPGPGTAQTSQHPQQGFASATSCP